MVVSDMTPCIPTHLTRLGMVMNTTTKHHLPFTARAIRRFRANCPATRSRGLTDATVRARSAVIVLPDTSLCVNDNEREEEGDMGLEE